MGLIEKLSDYEGIDLSGRITHAAMYRHIRLKDAKMLIKNDAYYGIMKHGHPSGDPWCLSRGLVKNLVTSDGFCTTYMEPILLRIRLGGPTFETVLEHRDCRQAHRIQLPNGFQASFVVTSSSR